MDVLNWLSFVIVSSEDLDLKSMIEALGEIEDRSAMHLLRADPCFFLYGHEHGERRGWTDKPHHKFSHCGRFDRLSGFDLATEPIVPVGRLSVA